MNSDTQKSSGGKRRRRINWFAVGSFLFGAIGALFTLAFFPVAILFGVIGGFLGERALRIASDEPGNPGRALAWWAVVTCAVTFVLALSVALQAQFVLNDPDLLRSTLESLEATPSS